MLLFFFWLLARHRVTWVHGPCINVGGRMGRDMIVHHLIQHASLHYIKPPTTARGRGSGGKETAREIKKVSNWTDNAQRCMSPITRSRIFTARRTHNTRI